MGTRPLHAEELTGIKERLGKAQEQMTILQRYITGLESELTRGTAWVSDMTLEDYKLMEADALAFKDWLFVKGGQGAMPQDLYKYKWGWM